MGQKTYIEWTDSTINATSGCDGCELYKPDANGDDQKRTCYAAEVHENRLAHSFPEKYAPKFNEVRMIVGRMEQAANWSDLTGKDRPDKPWLNGRHRHIFVGDMGDILSKAVTDEFLQKEILGAITSKSGQRHVWQILTKRPERLAKLARKWNGLPDNVVAMTTITNQRTADARVPWLLRTGHKHLGVSMEPMLGEIDMDRVEDLSPMDCSADWLEYIKWGICGCESGSKRRAMPVKWAINLAEQFDFYRASFFMKQMSVGGKVTGDMSQFPEALRVRQMPNIA